MSSFSQTQSLLYLCYVSLWLFNFFVCFGYFCVFVVIVCLFVVIFCVFETLRGDICFLSLLVVLCVLNELYGPV